MAGGGALQFAVNDGRKEAVGLLLEREAPIGG